MKKRKNTFLQTATYLVVLLFAINIVIIIFYAPIEKTMGIIQKIFYFHVSAGWLGMLFFIIASFAALIYLLTENNKWIRFANASVPLGLLFSSLNIMSGSIWAKSVWNTWWTWDPRLVTVTIMMILFIIYQLLRDAIDEINQKNKILSIYLLLSSCTVPLSFFSIRFFRTIHPIIINETSMSLSSNMKFVLFFTLASFTLLGIILFIFQLKFEKLNEKNENYHLKDY